MHRHRERAKHSRLVSSGTTSGSPHRLSLRGDRHHHPGCCPASLVPMRLRIPGWCSDPEISVNGNPTATLPPVLDGYITIDRHWLDGDIVQLPLPMRVTAISRDYGAAGLRLGPLVLALGIGENWCPVAGAPGLAEWGFIPRNLGTSGSGSKAPTVSAHGRSTDKGGSCSVRPRECTHPRGRQRCSCYGSARLRIAEFPAIAPDSAC